MDGVPRNFSRKKEQGTASLGTFQEKGSQGQRPWELFNREDVRDGVPGNLSTAGKPPPPVRRSLLKKKKKDGRYQKPFQYICEMKIQKSNERMKRIIFLFAVILMAVGMASAQGAKKAVLAVEQNVFDFGTIKEADGPVAHTFVVKNEGNAPLVLTRVVASCGCTSPEWPKEPIAPGKTAEVKVTFDPKDRPGMFAKTIALYSNGKRGSYILTLRGKVIGE